MFHLFVRAVALACISLFFNNMYAAKTILKGHFIYETDSVVIVSYHPSPINCIDSRPERIVAKADKNRNFSITLNISKRESINLMCGESWLFFNKFISPGDSLYFEFDTAGTKISGRGEDAFAGMFEFDRLFLTKERIAEMQGTLGKLHDTEFAKYWSDFSDSSIACYERIFAGKYLNPALKAAIYNEMRYEAAVNIVNYGWRGKYAHEHIFEMPGFRKYLNKFLVNDPAALASSHYVEFVRNIVRYSAEPMGFRKPRTGNFNQSNERCRVYDSIAKTLFTGEVYDVALYSILQNETQILERLKGGKAFDTSFKKAQKCISLFAKGFHNKRYLHSINEKMTELSKPEQDAFNFTLNDFNSRPMKLSDFKGKVVYLDFWATNCPPCIKELAPMVELQKTFEGADVAFVSISFDNDIDAPRKMIEKFGIGGTHLIEKRGFASDCAKHYHVSGIPRYILIGKNGKIISNDVPRPGSHPESYINNALMRAD